MTALSKQYWLYNEVVRGLTAVSKMVLMCGLTASRSTLVQRSYLFSQADLYG